MPGTPRLLTHDGKTQSLRAWAKEKHISMTTLASRLDLGWTLERALTTPVIKKFARNQKTVPTVKPMPVMREHKASGQARIWWGGEYHYLGKWSTPEAAEAYARTLEEIRVLGTLSTSKKGLLVGQLLLRFLDWAEAEYVKDGKATSEICSYRAVIRITDELYGDLPAQQFGPRQLKVVRGRFLAFVSDRGKPWTRQYVNEQVNRVRRIWSWAVEDDLVPIDTYLRLQRVRGLRKGKTPAVEQKKILPVRWPVVNATLPALPVELRVMVEVHWLAGCRSSEIVLLRECDLDTSGESWLWHPHQYKTAHLTNPGEDLAYWFGPRAVAILKTLLGRRPPDAYLFPGPPGHDRGRGRLPRWSRDSYGDAIREACGKLGLPPWSPRQIRKGRADEIRLAQHAAGRDGLEAAAAVLGHASSETTASHYTQRLELARVIQAEMG